MMKFNEFKNSLKTQTELSFAFENGNKIPDQFHITEVGLESKKFIDCGGNFRFEEKVVFQLWVMNDDEDHRLSVDKLNKIINQSEVQLGIENMTIVIEYQGNTIERYGIKLSENTFILIPLTTSCLAPDQCGIPSKKKISLSDLAGTCSPKSGCC